MSLVAPSAMRPTMRASVTNARQALPPLEAQPVVEPVTRGPSNLWKGKVAVRAAQWLGAVRMKMMKID